MTPELHLLPMAASICLLTALVQAWIMTWVRYFEAPLVLKILPNYRDFVRSHVDYLIMTGIVFSTFLVLLKLEIALAPLACWLIFIGALYNPFGFILQAIKPDIAESGGIVTKAGTVIAFFPLTIGLVWAAVEILSTSYSLL